MTDDARASGDAVRRWRVAFGAALVIGGAGVLARTPRLSARGRRVLDAFKADSMRLSRSDISNDAAVAALFGLSALSAPMYAQLVPGREPSGSSGCGSSCGHGGGGGCGGGGGSGGCGS